MCCWAHTVNTCSPCSRAGADDVKQAGLSEAGPTLDTVRPGQSRIVILGPTLDTAQPGQSRIVIIGLAQECIILKGIAGFLP